MLAGMVPLLHPRHRPWVLGTVEFAVAVAVLILPLFVVGRTEYPVVPVMLWSTLLAASLIPRRISPLISVVLYAAGGTGLLLFVGYLPPVVAVAVLIMYSVARNGEVSTSIIAWAVALVAAIWAPLTWLASVPSQYRFFTGVLLSTLALALLLSAWLLGWAVALRTRAADMETRMTEQSFRYRAQTSQQETALAEGKARGEVARELHDVVAHSLSVIVVQAEGAKALSAKRPDAAPEALDVIAPTGRASIHEMRRIVGLLRGESDATFGPTPSLTQIPEMVAAAGDRITLEMPEEIPAVPDSVGLAAFRVVQESVTNFLKHAGPTAEAKVRIGISPTEINIRVTDDGLGAQSSRASHAGAGLKGMEERVHAMGGTITTGPRSGGGYQVRAVLPQPAQLGQGWMSNER